MKETLQGIHPSYNCAKFKTQTIYAFPRALPRFLVHLGSPTGFPGSKNQSFQKINKKTSRDLPKL